MQTVKSSAHLGQPDAIKPAEMLHLAIVGCGGISEHYMRAISELDRVQVVAAVDNKLEVAESFQKRHRVPKIFADYREMLSDVGPDAVCVCTPNLLHAPVTIAALKAGAHVMTEKPMALTPAECTEMIHAAEAAKRKLAVGFQYRFHPATQMLKRAADAGQFGNVMHVRCQALRRRGVPNWGVFGQKKLQGGGPLIDIGVHVLEMAHYVMGSPRPISAAGNTWTFDGNRPNHVPCMWPGWDWQKHDIEDLAVGQIRFENGAILHIEASFIAHVEKDVWNFQISGTKGGANWDPPQIYTNQAGTMVNIAPAYLPPMTFDGLFKAKMANFIAAVLDDAPLEAPAWAGLAVQEMIDGIYRSAEAGHEIALSAK
jgi:predicted dehydrogenase